MDETRIENLTHGIDRAFSDKDLYMREFFLERLWEMKWQRIALIQGGLS